VSFYTVSLVLSCTVFVCAQRSKCECTVNQDMTAAAACARAADASFSLSRWQHNTFLRDDVMAAIFKLWTNFKASSFQIGSRWNLAEMLFKKIGVNRPTHWLTELDFRFDVILSRWRPWRHFTHKSASAWWVRASTRCLCNSILQFRIHSLIMKSIICCCTTLQNLR